MKKLSIKLIVAIMTIMLIAVFCLVGCNNPGSGTDTEDGKNDTNNGLQEEKIDTIAEMLEYAPKTTYDILYSALNLPEKDAPENVYITILHDNKDTITEIETRYFTTSDKAITTYSTHLVRDIKVSELLSKKVSFGTSLSSFQQLSVSREQSETYKPVALEYAKKNNIKEEDIICLRIKDMTSKEEQKPEFRKFVLMVDTNTAIYSFHFEVRNADTIQMLTANVINGALRNETVKKTDLGILLDKNAVDKEFPPKDTKAE